MLLLAQWAGRSIVPTWMPKLSFEETSPGSQSGRLPSLPSIPEGPSAPGVLYFKKGKPGMLRSLAELIPQRALWYKP